MAVTLVASVGGAPRAQFDYYLTGNAADASGDTVFGLGLMCGGTDVDAPGSRAIAIDRETAVLVDDKGKATIVANSDHPTPYAYFIEGGSPEVVLPGTRSPTRTFGCCVPSRAVRSTFKRGAAEASRRTP